MYFWNIQTFKHPIMRKILYFTSLGLLLLSCESQKPVVAKNNQPVPVAKTQGAPISKPEVKHHIEGDYFTTNISDPTKNDNTISYGSLVAANPKGYKITRNYFPSVAQNFRQRYIILHYTALEHDKSAMVLTQQAVSSHYLINDTDDKEIYQLVDENKRAYHAGVSAWRNDRNLNDTSIGIEMVNKGYVMEGTKRVFFPFPEFQYQKIASLVKDLVERYKIPPINILGHSDIAPTRKQDPGPLFPWKRLYDEHGIGMWYDNATMQNFLSTIDVVNFPTVRNDIPFIYKVQTALRDLGYAIELSGSWDDVTKKTIEAFQFRFRPANYDGILDAETWAILQSLNVKYP